MIRVSDENAEAAELMVFGHRGRNDKVHHPYLVYQLDRSLKLFITALVRLQFILNKNNNNLNDITIFNDKELNNLSNHRLRGNQLYVCVAS